MRQMILPMLAGNIFGQTSLLILLLFLLLFLLLLIWSSRLMVDLNISKEVFEVYCRVIKVSSYDEVGFWDSPIPPNMLKPEVCLKGSWKCTNCSWIVALFRLILCKSWWTIKLQTWTHLGASEFDLVFQTVYRRIRCPCL